MAMEISVTINVKRDRFGRASGFVIGETAKGGIIIACRHLACVVSYSNGLISLWIKGLYGFPRAPYY